MGLIKEYLMDRTSELAMLLGIDDAEFYKDDNLNNMAQAYAQYKLYQDGSRDTTREEIKKAILTRTDEVIDLMQGLLKECNADKSNCCGVCLFSFLCEASAEYDKGGDK